MQLDELLRVMDTLMGPQGCPWDRAQTHESLRDNMLEEAQEAVEAIDQRDMASLREELGDVLLQVVFHGILAQQAGHFTLQEVADGLVEKLVRRHSHVFGDHTAATPEEALRIWEANKAAEKRA